MRKGFYQQALTLIEARMPKTLCDRKIYSITDAGREFCRTNSVRGNSEHLTETDLFNGCLFSFSLGKKDWKGLFNSIFESSDYGKIASQLLQCVRKKLERGVDNVLNDVRRSNVKLRSGKPIICPNAIEFAEEIKEDATKKALILLLWMHRAIKDIRNNSNHASESNGYEEKSVKNAIYFYLWLIDGLTDIIRR